MGKYISKLVFMPPPFYSQPDDDTKYLNTSHNSRIQFRFINRNAKYNILISHGNAEDIISVSDWVINKFSKLIDANFILYGKIFSLISSKKYIRVYRIWRK